MKKALVCGAGGFIGGHLVGRLLDEGYEVHALDIKTDPDWYQLHLTRDVDRFFGFDLRNPVKVKNIIRINQYDEIYQLAADMGGAGYIFTGDHDADVMHNSATINLNVAQAVAKYSKLTKVFYSSSACIYPAENQTDPDNPNCKEDSAYPANPDSEYGWEKLFSERLWRAYARNYGLNVRIARFHNIFGPRGTWDGGKEKAPAAMCRKAIQSKDKMEVWGDGQQTRSFLYIDECLEAIRRLMNSDVEEIINIGSEEMIKINDLAQMALDIAGKDVTILNIPGPEGVRGRNSDNYLIGKLLGWKPMKSLYSGMEKTFKWIEKEIKYAS
jgi:nucleoside-diphosphate-sugar epimerase